MKPWGRLLFRGSDKVLALVETTDKSSGDSWLKNLKTLKGKIVLGCRVLYEEGVFDAYGHLSARIPDSGLMVITPRASPAFVRPNDLVVLDMNGKVVKGRNPPSEAVIHSSIYNSRKDVMSVAHFHSPMAIALGIVGKTLQPLHGEGRLFSGGVPLFNKSLRIRTAEDSKQVSTTLGEKRAVLLRGHGAVVVGETVEMACIGSIYLESAARMQWLSSFLGVPRPLTEEESVESMNLPRAWEYYVNRHRFSKRSAKRNLLP